MSANYKKNNHNLVGLIGIIPLAPYVVSIVLQHTSIDGYFMGLIYVITAVFLPSFYLSVCLRDALKDPVEKQYALLLVATFLHIVIFLFTFMFNPKDGFYIATFGVVIFTVIFAIIIKRYSMPIKTKK